MTLFFCSTGENWHLIMIDCMGLNSMYVFYFIFFVLIVKYVMLNLFILVVLTQFEENFLNDDNPLNHFNDMEEDFKDIWV